ncbi:SxtJ family membrane protein [Fundidesulfovibrio agrisoli]|uniref:SxtJ family membrane protein n=1 Tax=Fundidesulfovibrio agrisoli TaxID=2922717 RepID=UPI001FABD0FE|nr:SxtJ family membrane protein [Fundidesulfovibrio agrisoli]
MPPKTKGRTSWLGASTAQARDTGMALVLVCLLIAWLGDKKPFLAAGVLLLVLNMTWPAAYKPAAKVWFGLSHLLGTVMSKLLLGAVFFLVLTPMGLLRRLLGKDPMQARKWKQDATSVFRVRDHLFTSKDIETPY